MSCFQKQCTRCKNKKKVETDFSNYATKSDLKNATAVDASEFARNID